MPVSEQVLGFRRNRAAELEQFARVLHRLGICEPYPIYEAAKQLKDPEYVLKVSNDDRIDYNYWGYTISNLAFPFNKTPRHTYPEKVINLGLNLSIKIICDFEDFEKIKDPFKYLEFNIYLSGTHLVQDGTQKEVVSSLHLDRHLTSPEDYEPDEIHPIYHFQFGGRKLDKKFKDFGNSLILDSPRIVHYPMDAILGVDFVLANFFPNQWRELRKDGEYINLVRLYQRYFWKSYVHTKASHWKPFEQNAVEWDPILIWPNLIINVAN
jgi:hypothetical protein